MILDVYTPLSHFVGFAAISAQFVCIVRSNKGLPKTERCELTSCHHFFGEFDCCQFGLGTGLGARASKGVAA